MLKSGKLCQICSIIKSFFTRIKTLYIYINNALLNAFKNYKITKGNFALKLNDYCYLKKLNKNNLKYTFNTNDYKIYKTLEEATTDQNYINKYFSFKCEVISL